MNGFLEKLEVIETHKKDEEEEEEEEKEEEKYENPIEIKLPQR